jgi:hypothetical protein
LLNYRITAARRLQNHGSRNDQVRIIGQQRGRGLNYRDMNAAGRIIPRVTFLSEPERQQEQEPAKLTIWQRIIKKLTIKQKPKARDPSGWRNVRGL